jgi:hypothetical protein
MKHNAARTATDNGPDGTPALRRSSKKRRKMSILEVVEHGEK